MQARFEKTGSIPLKSIHVKGRADGLWLTAAITQTYRNTTDQTIEAVYSFPLAMDTAVTGLSAVIDGKRLQARCLPRGKAESAYEAAIEKGDAPVMLEYHVEQSLCTANLGSMKPGEAIEVEVRIAKLLRQIGESVRIALPTVAAERYDGDGTQGGLPAHARLSYDRNAEYPYTAEIELAGGLEHGKVQVPGWKAEFESRPETVLVRARGTADRDLVIRVSGVHVPARALCFEENGETSVLSWFMPKMDAPTLPLNLTLLVDCSGSMEGPAIGQVRQAIKFLAQNLTAEDKLSIWRFGSEILPVIAEPTACTPSFVRRDLLPLIDGMEADLGGTRLYDALIKILLQPGEADVLLLTDGRVFDVRRVIPLIGNSGRRVFVIGFGIAPCDAFLSRCAAVSNALSTSVFPGEDLSDAVLDMLGAMATLSEPLSLPGQQALPYWSNMHGDQVFAGRSQNNAFLFRETPDSLRFVHGRKDAVVPVQAADRTVAQYVADQRIKSGALYPEAAERLAVRFNVLSPHTHLILTAEREPGQKAELPAGIVTVPQQLSCMPEADDRIDFCAAIPGGRETGSSFDFEHHLRQPGFLHANHALGENNLFPDFIFRTVYRNRLWYRSREQVAGVLKGFCLADGTFVQDERQDVAAPIGLARLCMRHLLLCIEDEAQKPSRSLKIDRETLLNLGVDDAATPGWLRSELGLIERGIEMADDGAVQRLADLLIISLENDQRYRIPSAETAPGKVRTLEQLANIVCRAWYELDAKILEPVLADDLHYSSFWVFEEMHGKERYLEYISAKFRLLRNNPHPETCWGSARVLYQAPIGKHVVLIAQKGKEFALELNAAGGMITSMWMRPVDLLAPDGCLVLRSVKPSEK